MTTMTVDTDHGVYEAFPWRESEDGPAGAVLTVFCEDGSIAGYVTGSGGAYSAHVGGDPRPLAVRLTVEGAVSLVAERDHGLAPPVCEYREAQDTEYAHLVNAQCACGWSASGFTGRTAAWHFWRRHMGQA